MPGRRPRGRPKRRFMDGVKEDMKVVGVREEDAEDKLDSLCVDAPFGHLEAPCSHIAQKWRLGPKIYADGIEGPTVEFHLSAGERRCGLEELRRLGGPDHTSTLGV
ncbi:hypothetical protein D4764_10G0004420 [Takifugu flavidus]|uniref:Uncharacterized protein n=1 Tax=Takifugu flavidus TaxID=433684 RepID=A0A5C6PHX7_9TELE|nr:hypothetical protein D4764_10G0004420 [Takifugu flavidus]